MSYTAAVLSETSQLHLKKLLKELVPNTWEWVGHHMTLHMGDPLPTDEVGKEVMLTARFFARDEKVIAIKIMNGRGLSTNPVPHITIAVNRDGGGKPKDSNNLTNWVELRELIDLNFIVLIAKIEHVQ